MKNFSFIKNQKFFFGIVIAALVVGIVSFIVRGFNLDIDFVGGTEISYNMGQPITKEDEAVIENDVKAIIGTENFSSLRVSGEKDIVTIRTLVMDNSDNTDEVSAAIDAKLAELYSTAALSADSTETDKIFTLADENTEDDQTPSWTDEDVTAVKTALEAMEPYPNGLNVSADGANLLVSFTSSSIVAQYRSEITDAITEKFENASWRSTDTVSAEVSDDLKKTAIMASIIAVVLMLIYIAFRFQVSSAFAAILCLVHDLFVNGRRLFTLPDTC